MITALTYSTHTQDSRNEHISYYTTHSNRHTHKHTHTHTQFFKRHPIPWEPTPEWFGDVAGTRDKPQASDRWNCQHVRHLRLQQTSNTVLWESAPGFTLKIHVHMSMYFSFNWQTSKAVFTKSHVIVRTLFFCSLFSFCPVFSSLYESSSSLQSSLQTLLSNGFPQEKPAY
jgi:hypothetical protein